MPFDTQEKSLSVGAKEVDALAWLPRRPLFYLVLGHGAGAGMQHPFMTGLAETFAAADVATVRYQFPYMQAGKRLPDRPQTLIATVSAALQWARELASGKSLLLGGKSMGGRMSAEAWACGAASGVHGLVFFGFPLHAAGKLSMQRAAALKTIQCPMLFLQGARDKLADADLIATTCASLTPWAELVNFPDADHGFALPKRAGINMAQMHDKLVTATVQWWKQHFAHSAT